MSDFFDLVQQIKTSQNLTTEEASGFYAVYCPVCGKRNKKTGGWKFDVDTIGYNCFRGSCDSSCVFSLGEPISKKFQRLMDIIGATIPIELKVSKTNIKKSKFLEREMISEHSFNPMIRPKHFLKLEEAEDDKAQKFVKYFTSRCCSLDDIFYITDGDYNGCAAIEMRYNRMIIGYSIVTGSSNAKYINYSTNNNLIYIPEGRIKNTVFVVEGRLDAKVFPNTVSIGGSKITKKQAYFLIGKRVIMIPDRSNNGFIKQYKEYDWEICIPDWDVNDLAAAVKKYGTIITAKKVMDGICKTDLEANIRYKKWCLND